VATRLLLEWKRREAGSLGHGARAVSAKSVDGKFQEVEHLEREYVNSGLQNLFGGQTLKNRGSKLDANSSRKSAKASIFSWALTVSRCAPPPHPPLFRSSASNPEPEPEQGKGGGGLTGGPPGHGGGQE
jgi:hypothetical protein